MAAPDYPAVDRIEITSSDERRIDLKVIFTQVASPQDADSIASILAGQLADRLAFVYSIAATDPLKGEGSFINLDASGGIHAVLSDHLPLSCSGHITNAVAPLDVPALIPQLQTFPLCREPYLAQFRWIICQDDSVVRFMHLYKILLSLEGGPRHGQGPVDSFIVGREPLVATVFNPHPRVNRDETIYTRLRNEIGHEIAGTTPSSTRLGMEQHVAKLTDHVKAAIAKLT